MSADDGIEEHRFDDRQSPAEAPLAPIAEVAHSLAAALDVLEIMQRVNEGALRLTHAHGAYVERITSGREEVEVVAVAGQGTPTLGTRVAFPGSLTEVIITGAAPRDLARMEKIGESIAPYLAESCRGCSALVVPLISQEEALGALVLLRDPQSVEFPPEEVAEARTLGDLASASLRRVLLLEQAEQERAHFSALLESTGEGIYGIDPVGRCTFINSAAARMIGYSPEECLGRDMHLLIHHHHRDGTRYPLEECPIFRSFQLGECTRVDHEVLWRRDGTSFPAEYASYPLFRDGQTTGAVVTFVDRTERKRAEAAEQRYTERLRGLAEAALAINSAPSLGVALQLITDRAREVIGAHQSVTSMTLGITLGSEWAQAINAVSLSEKYAAWRDYDEIPDGSGIYHLVAELKLPIRLTQAELEAHPAWRGFGKHATEHPPMRGWLAVPLVARDGRNIGLIQLSDRDEGEFTEQDETILVQFAQIAAVAIENARLYEDAQVAREVAEGARRDADTARAEAQAANLAKSEFLASMSHEIRTPINAIVGYTDLLAIEIAGPLTAGQKAQLERIRVSAQHLTGLIDDMLDLAKIEAGRMTVENERALAINAVAAALELVRPQAAERGLEIEETCSVAESPTYFGDEDRVRQILANLLSNAVKFTPAGKITVKCGSTDRPDPGADLPGEGRWTYIRVTDTGIGIAPEEIESIFRPFVQAERGHTRTRGGTGLGLSISRQLAILMGGGLSVRSEPGKGSSFTLWLASEAAEYPPITESVLAETRGEGGRSRGLAAVGDALQEEAPAVLDRYMERLRQDAHVQMADDLGEADLEDHAAPFLADLGQSLVILEKSRAVPERLLRDGSDIQHLIAELHGRQRAQLGWTEEALRREFEILREEIEAGVRQSRHMDSETQVESGLELLQRFLDRAEQISLRGLRRAKALEVT
ncbi:MAG: PAS domain S-box protein [Gemmatimonadetes bacterium]|nr:PAS domain S-box protein [Gemmatimonadota bacterium]